MCILVYVYLYIFKYVKDKYIHVQICKYVNMYICICIFVYMCLCTHAHTYIYIHVHIHICIYGNIHIYICIYVYVYVQWDINIVVAYMRHTAKFAIFEREHNDKNVTHWPLDFPTTCFLTGLFGCLVVGHGIFWHRWIFVVPDSWPVQTSRSGHIMVVGGTLPESGKTIRVEGD